MVIFFCKTSLKPWQMLNKEVWQFLSSSFTRCDVVATWSREYKLSSYYYQMRICNQAIDALTIPLTTGPYRSKNPERSEPNLVMEIGQIHGKCHVTSDETILQIFYLAVSVIWFYSAPCTIQHKTWCIAVLHVSLLLLLQHTMFVRG
jgi:hypothetical protein